MVDLEFHRFYLCGNFRDVITKIVNLNKIFSSSFLTLSAFSASDLSLLFDQFFLFYPKYIFFFFGHGLVEQGVFLSHVASRPSWMHVNFLFQIIGLIIGTHELLLFLRLFLKSGVQLFTSSNAAELVSALTAEPFAARVL
ncbi:hypothetical protein N665_0021s0014 [Sinapis alba]|nr:hypothetical protein N665_0021s0014 [Sinapis alba]